MSRYRKLALREFQPYVPGLQPADGTQWVKLNTNESPFPPAPGVAGAIAREVQRLNLYPDPAQTALRVALAGALDVTPEQLIAGNGGDEILDMAVRAFVPPGGRVAYAGPTYSLIPALLRIQEAVGEQHRYTSDFALPSSIFDSDAPLKYIGNPNSPTGTVLETEVIADLCTRSDGVVLVDEAYVDFAPRSALPLIDAHPNLLLVRTMSKSFNLAGLRLGYAVASADLVADLWSVKGSYNVGRLPMSAGVAALADLAYRDRCVAEIVDNRVSLTRELEQRDYKVLPSGANFVFAIPPTPALDVHRALTERHVLVRHFAEPGVDHGLRITVGTWEQCQALLDAIDQVGT